jgi:hypothetical protein
MDELERAYREGSGNDIFTIKIDPILDDPPRAATVRSVGSENLSAGGERETMNLRIISSASGNDT